MYFWSFTECIQRHTFQEVNHALEEVLYQEERGSFCINMTRSFALNMKHSFADVTSNNNNSIQAQGQKAFQHF